MQHSESQIADFWFKGIIVRKVSKDEIKDAWKQLFTVYAKVEDSILKKPIIEIARTSSKVMLEDIVTA